MSGNGVDLGAIYQAIIAQSEDFKAFKAEVRAEFREVRSELRGIKQELRQEIDELRQTVNADRGSVLGHGILITELDEPVRRLEQQRPA